MATERKNIEVLVGLFLLMGLSVIAIMVVTFGRVGQSFQDYYQITVEFPNASGLVKDSDVFLAGAKIGFVATVPKLVGRSYAVEVKLSINTDTKIPRNSSFLVGSSGLMGDRFVDVIPLPDFNPEEVLEAGARFKGSRAPGMDDLTAKGDVVMDQLNSELEKIKKITDALHQNLLNEQNLKNLEATFANLKTTSENFSEGSKKLGPIFDEAKVAVASAKDTMKSMDAAAGDLRKAIDDIRKTADTATKTLDSGRELIKKASQGSGPLGTLLSDRQASEDLKSFLTNLRRSGPIFYKDRPLPAAIPLQREASR